MSLIEKIIYEFNNNKGAVVFVLVLFLALKLKYNLNNERREWDKCHNEAIGYFKKFYLSSNKLLLVEIAFKVNKIDYVVEVTTNNYLHGCFYSKEKNCIGQKCIVYYACDNPKNIRYKLIEQDSLR